MKSAIYGLAVMGSLLVVGARLAFPCVPDGGTSTTTLNRPALPPPPSGAPSTSSRWEGSDPDPSGSPQAEEHDDASSNEPMGDAAPSASGNSASVDVSNSGGDLSGPNGDVVNGGWEGDCIEIEICWYYWTWEYQFYFTFTETGFRTQSRWVWARKEVCNGGNDVEVCPC